MTIEKAIEIIRRYECCQEHYESCEMAITALEQKPCKDCVSRQVVDTLVDELARAISDERSCLSRGRSAETIMHDILDLPSVTPQPTRWIPVDERLPEHDKNVLMFYSQDKMEIGYYHYDSTFYPTEFEDLNETGWYTKEDDVADDPVAWMSLPECYKGGD